jgi:hypothetical protein
MYKVLKSALVEKDVENAYRSELAKAFDYLNAEFTSKYGTDGIVKAWKYKNEDLDLIMLLEFKYDENFKDRTNIIRVLIQALYYLKMFEKFGDDLPHVVLIGDINECFCLHSNNLITYLAHDIDWSIAPSSAANKNPELLREMYNDEEITPYIFNVDEHFNFTTVIEKAIDLSKDIVNFVRITEKNINRVFDEFINTVLYSSKLTKQNANELVNIFISVIVNPADNYIHPKRPQTLVTKDLGSVRVHNDKFKAFFRHFQREYSPREKDWLVAICDRLIEDTSRRFRGEFFTPTEWVEEAHRMIETEFGEDWKEKYVVWDPACGTCNLTRDYKFKELYASTINEEDIGIANQRGYNSEAVKFQFDFLNDPDEKFPEGLKKALEEKKPMIVFMNPPYGTATESALDPNVKRKTGIGKNKVNEAMLQAGLKRASDQLYAQFLFRVNLIRDMYNLVDINFTVFLKPLFMSGMYFNSFRNMFLTKFEFRNSMLFNAAHFSNTSNAWGISFSIWRTGITENKTDFAHTVKDLDENCKVTEIQQKIIYNADNKEALSDWVRKEIRGIKPIDEPKLKGPLSVVNNKRLGRRQFDSIGFMQSNSNQVQCNARLVGLYSSTFSAENTGFPVTKRNFHKGISAFCARKSITQNWINDKDEYMAPNTEHPDYKQWNNDCLIYSLFNNSSNQSSLRDIDYKDKKWDIINEWFWMSVEDMRELAEEYKFDELYSDCRNFAGERFIYKKLPETELSDDAGLVYNKAVELVKESFKYREILHREHPEYHLDTWDAGWYQIKKILKQFMLDDLKEFRKLYKEFEDRMREGVYKFGFLK